MPGIVHAAGTGCTPRQLLPLRSQHCLFPASPHADRNLQEETRARSPGPAGTAPRETDKALCPLQQHCVVKVYSWLRQESNGQFE